MGRKRNYVIDIRFTTEEGDAVKAMAGKYLLSLSEYGRRLMLDLKIPDPSNYQAVQALYAVRADLRPIQRILEAAVARSEADVSSALGQLRELMDQLGETALEIGARPRLYARRGSNHPRTRSRLLKRRGGKGQQ